MNKELELWQHALAAIGRGERCVLLLVVESIGSSPGRAGFKALVTSGGELHGSIGGGSMEHKLVELARRRLASGSRGGDPEGAIGGDPEGAVGSPPRDPAATILPMLKRQIHRAEEPTDRSGMICSGEQTVAFFQLGKKEVKLVREVSDGLQHGRTIGLLLGNEGIRTGDLPRAADDKVLHKQDPEHWHYRERLGSMPRIIILGAGHVGLALSRTMNQLGFHVHLMDDRADLNTMAANQWAHTRSVVDYEHIGDVITADPELYVVLVSFGYRTDDVLVRQLVRKRFKYLGMMGSVEKIRKLLADMRKDGFSEEELARIRTPIGLPINSKTPEEIAVSIAAEIVLVKNG
ncbi:MAG: XdhC family protein [Flavobacteriales bacterium]|nr:XdhC family protein [Flavobacteriales bacterium]